MTTVRRTTIDRGYYDQNAWQIFDNFRFDKTFNSRFLDPNRHVCRLSMVFIKKGTFMQPLPLEPPSSYTRSKKSEIQSATLPPSPSPSHTPRQESETRTLFSLLIVLIHLFSSKLKGRFLVSDFLIVCNGGPFYACLYTAETVKLDTPLKKHRHSAFQMYENFQNFQGFPYVGGKIAINLRFAILCMITMTLLALDQFVASPSSRLEERKSILIKA